MRRRHVESKCKPQSKFHSKAQSQSQESKFTNKNKSRSSKGELTHMKLNRFVANALAMVLLLSILLLTACSSGSSGTTTSPGGEGDPQGTGQTSETNESKETIKLRIGSGATVEGAVWVRMIQEYFIPEVDQALENTNYEIDWTTAFGGTVAKLGEELTAVEDNLLDLSFVSGPLHTAVLKITNIGYNTPFSSSDPEVITKAANQLLEKYPEFASEYGDANQTLLGIAVTEGYELITKFPVNQLDDLAGKKMSAVGSNLHWIEAIGTVPVQGNLGEAYQSLQSGVYEGWVMFPGSINGYKLYEPAPYYTEVGLGSVILGGLTVNNDVWGRLPDDVKAVLEQKGREWSDKVAAETKNRTQLDLDEMKENNVHMGSLSTEERKKWVEKVAQIPNHYAKQLNDAGLPGTQIMQEYIQFQKDAGHEFPVDYVIE